jgi:hypothetical protein
MANPRVTIVVAADAAEARRAFEVLTAQVEKTGNAATGMGAKFQSVMGGIGAGIGIAAFNMFSNAVSSVTDVLRDSVSAALEEETRLKLLKVTLEATIPAWDGNIAAIERRIEAGMRLGFTDDEMSESFKRLTTATGDVAKATDLNALAMDFARLRGIDLLEATNLITKANAGQIGMLRRILPWIDKNATAEEALVAIRKVAAGQSEAYADTTQGKMVRAQIQMNEAMEELGTLILPVIGSLAQLATEILPQVGQAFKDATPYVDAFLRGLQEIGDTAAWAIASSATGMRTGLAEITRLNQSHAAEIANLGMKYKLLGPAVSEGLAEWTGGWRRATGAVTTYLNDAEREAIRLGGRLPGAIAKALVDGRGTMFSAALALVEAMKKPWTDALSVSQAIGILHSAKVAAGLRSANPYVRQASQDLVNAAQAVLTAGAQGAFYAGQNMGKAFQAGLRGKAGFSTSGIPTSGAKAGTDALDTLVAQATAALGGGGGGGGGIAGAVDKLADTLKAKLAAAFDTVRTRALAALDKIHTAKLRAIEDARKLRDAELDAQIAAAQAPVTAAQAALDAKREAQRLAELQRSLSEAQASGNMESAASAQAALDDYLAQAAIDRMQAAADVTISGLEAKKKENDDLAAAQVIAEDARYEAQQAQFTKDERALEKHLAKTKAMWAESAREISALLAEFGLIWAPGGGVGEAKSAAVPKAAGGAVSASGSYLVGEHGPELFVPGSAGSIVPNGALGGPVNISVNVSGAALFDPYGSAAQQIADALLPGVRRALTRNGMSLA